MSTWRRIGFSGIVMGVIGLATFLPGCGGGAGNTDGSNTEVKAVEPTDAQGNTYSVDDEAAEPNG